MRFTFQLLGQSSLVVLLPGHIGGSASFGASPCVAALWGVVHEQGAATEAHCPEPFQMAIYFGDVKTRICGILPSRLKYRFGRHPYPRGWDVKTLFKLAVNTAATPILEVEVPTCVELRQPPCYVQAIGQSPDRARHRRLSAVLVLTFFANETSFYILLSCRNMFPASGIQFVSKRIKAEFLIRTRIIFDSDSRMV
jgi:hypothetical protein